MHMETRESDEIKSVHDTELHTGNGKPLFFGVCFSLQVREGT